MQMKTNTEKKTTQSKIHIIMSNNDDVIGCSTLKPVITKL